MTSVNGNTKAARRASGIPLLGTLFDVRQGRLRYILKAFALSLFPAMALSILLALLLPAAESVAFEGGPVFLFVVLVIFTPLLETALLWLTLTIIGLFTRTHWATALLAALCWAILHSLEVALWGVIIFWSFTVFSLAFLAWRQVSRRDAFMVCCAIHMLQNSVAFLGTLLATV